MLLLLTVDELGRLGGRVWSADQMWNQVLLVRRREIEAVPACMVPRGNECDPRKLFHGGSKLDSIYRALYGSTLGVVQLLARSQRRKLIISRGLVHGLVDC